MFAHEATASTRQIRFSSAGASEFRGGGYFQETPGLDLIDITVDRDLLRHERVRADAFDICRNALRLLADRQPIDVLAVV